MSKLKDYYRLFDMFKGKLTEAQKEAADADAHVAELLESGEVYIKKTAKGADGSITTTFEKVDVEA